MNFRTLCTLFILSLGQFVHAGPIPQFTQNLGAQLPLAARFTDAHARRTTLGDYFGTQPVILVFGYYRCPRLCSTVMEGVLQGLESTGLAQTVVAISVDPRETHHDAANRLRAYQGLVDSEGALHLLTGEQAQIAALARVAGFQYTYDAASGQYSHPAGFIVATPDGRISRYFSGLRFDRRDVRLALIEASDQRIGSLTEQVMLLCSHYDPVGGRYNLAVMSVVRAVGLFTLVILAAGVWLKRRETRRHFAPPKLAAKSLAKRPEKSS